NRDQERGGSARLEPVGDTGRGLKDLVPVPQVEQIAKAERGHEVEVLVDPSTPAELHPLTNDRQAGGRPFHGDYVRGQVVVEDGRLAPLATLQGQGQGLAKVVQTAVLSEVAPGDPSIAEGLGR